MVWMQLDATVTSSAGEQIGMLSGTIRLTSRKGQTVVYDYSVDNLNVFDLETDKIAIEIRRNDQVIANVPWQIDPESLTAEESARRFILESLVSEGVNNFIDLLTTFGFEGKPFVKSEQLSDEEATWLVFRTIAGKTEPILVLDGLKDGCDIMRLLHLIFH